MSGPRQPILVTTIASETGQEVHKDASMRDTFILPKIVNNSIKSKLQNSDKQLVVQYKYFVNSTSYADYKPTLNQPEQIGDLVPKWTQLNAKPSSEESFLVDLENKANCIFTAINIRHQKLQNALKQSSHKIHAMRSLLQHFSQGVETLSNILNELNSILSKVQKDISTTSSASSLASNLASINLPELQMDMLEFVTKVLNIDVQTKYNFVVNSVTTFLNVINLLVTVAENAKKTISKTELKLADLKSVKSQCKNFAQQAFLPLFEKANDVYSSVSSLLGKAKNLANSSIEGVERGGIIQEIARNAYLDQLIKFEEQCKEEQWKFQEKMFSFDNGYISWIVHLVLSKSNLETCMGRAYDAKKSYDQVVDSINDIIFVKNLPLVYMDTKREVLTRKDFKESIITRAETISNEFKGKVDEENKRRVDFEKKQKELLNRKFPEQIFAGFIDQRVPYFDINIEDFDAELTEVGKDNSNDSWLVLDPSLTNSSINPLKQSNILSQSTRNLSESGVIKKAELKFNQWKEKNEQLLKELAEAKVENEKKEVIQKEVTAKIQKEHEEQVNLYQEKINELTEQVAKVASELDAAKAEHSRQAFDNQQIIQTLQSQLQNVKEEKEKAESEKSKLQSALQKIQDALVTEKKNHDTTSSTLQAKERNIASLEEVIRQKEEQIKVLQSSVASKESQTKTLQDTTMNKEQKISSLMKDMENLEAAKKQLEDKLEKSYSVREMMLREKEDKSAEQLDALKKQFTARDMEQTQQITKQAEDNARMQTEIDRLRNALLAKDQLLRNSDLELNNLRNTVASSSSKFTSEIQNLTNTVAALDAEKSKLNSSLKAAESELNNLKNATAAKELLTSTLQKTVIDYKDKIERSTKVIQDLMTKNQIIEPIKSALTQTEEKLKVLEPKIAESEKQVELYRKAIQETTSLPKLEKTAFQLNNIVVLLNTYADVLVELSQVKPMDRIGGKIRVLANELLSCANTTNDSIAEYISSKPQSPSQGLLLNVNDWLENMRQVTKNYIKLNTPFEQGDTVLALRTRGNEVWRIYVKDDTQYYFLSAESVNALKSVLPNYTDHIAHHGVVLCVENHYNTAQNSSNPLRLNVKDYSLVTVMFDESP